MNTHNISSIMVAAAVLLLLACYFVWFFWRSRSLLNKWAKENGYEITQAKLRWLFQGPFTGWSERYQTVYRIKVRNHQGYERSGWVCCGGFWAGLFNNRVRVEWDDTNEAEVKVGNRLSWVILASMIAMVLAGLFLPKNDFEPALIAIVIIAVLFLLFYVWKPYRRS